MIGWFKTTTFYVIGLLNSSITNSYYKLSDNILAKELVENRSFFKPLAIKENGLYGQFENSLEFVNVFEVLSSALIGYKPSFIGVVTCRKLEHAVAVF